MLTLDLTPSMFPQQVKVTGSCPVAPTLDSSQGTELPSCTSTGMALKDAPKQSVVEKEEYGTEIDGDASI